MPFLMNRETRKCRYELAEMLCVSQNPINALRTGPGGCVCLRRDAAVGRSLYCWDLYTEMSWCNTPRRLYQSLCLQNQACGCIFCTSFILNCKVRDRGLGGLPPLPPSGSDGWCSSLRTVSG